MRLHTVRPLAIALVTTCFAAALSAQHWSSLTGPTQRRVARAFDARRGRLVELGQTTVVEHALLGWTSIDHVAQPFVSPFARTDTAVAFDAVAGHVLMFGGRTDQAVGDFWSWDGVLWRQVNAPVGPARRSSAAMVYDSIRRRVVLHGGTDAGLLQDTWEWDGQQWFGPATGPAAVAPAMAFHAATGRTVLVFGGETHEWNGVAWQRVATAPAQTGALGYDAARQRTVFHHNLGTIHEWDGTTWSPALQTTIQTTVSTVFFDSRFGGLVLVADSGAGAWTWDGTTARALAMPGLTHRPEGLYVASFHDTTRQRIVALSRGTPTAETWSWDGARWTRMGIQGPSLLTLAGAAFDSTRGVGVVFGGLATTSTASNVSGSTWLWNGTAWTLSPAAGPSARLNPLMVFDAARARIVLHGGLASTGPLLDDTWEWDGSAWQNMSARAPYSFHHAMAFDPLRSVTVLVGGGATHEWNGTSWRLVVTPTPPLQFVRPTACFDPIRRTIVAAGSTDVPWTYDGVDWTRTTMPRPFASIFVLLPHPTRGTLQAFDVGNVVELQNQVAEVESLGHACGVPSAALMVRSRPRVGDAAFGFDAAVDAGQLALLGLSVQAAPVPLPNGCELRLAAPAAIVSTVADPLGTATVGVPLPTNPALVGAQFFAQVLAAAPSHTGGFVTTQTLRLRIGE